MKKIDKDFVNTLNKVLGFDISNVEDYIDNSCCGAGSLFETKKEAIECCSSLNALGEYFGWEKYNVYQTCKGYKFYVCLTESEYQELISSYKPV